MEKQSVLKISEKVSILTVKQNDLIVATASNGFKETIPYDYSETYTVNHERAAKRLIDAMEWGGAWYAGEVAMFGSMYMNGYVWVHVGEL